MKKRSPRSDIGKTRDWPARFWKNVDRRGDSDCWEWAGSRHYKGYGQVGYSGKMLKAHRVSYELATGRRPPDELVVMHTCDNPPCVNPSHLRLGTYSDNALDMFAKGRAVRARGEGHHNAKLSAELVRKIRADNRPQRTIASECGISQPLVGMVKRREIWKHVTD